MEAQIPNYPSLPPQLMCQLHNVTIHVSFGLYSLAEQEDNNQFLLGICATNRP
jgi:hypothetical protein